MCYRSISFNWSVFDDLVCATEPGRDACFSDSGSSLMVKGIATGTNFDWVGVLVASLRASNFPRYSLLFVVVSWSLHKNLCKKSRLSEIWRVSFNPEANELLNCFHCFFWLGSLVHRNICIRWLWILYVNISTHTV